MLKSARYCCLHTFEKILKYILVNALTRFFKNKTKFEYVGDNSKPIRRLLGALALLSTIALLRGIVHCQYCAKVIFLKQKINEKTVKINSVFRST